MHVVVPCTLHVDEYCSSHVRVSCIVEKCVEIMTSRGVLYIRCQDVLKLPSFNNVIDFIRRRQLAALADVLA